MGKVLVNENSLTSIANSIRAKNGTQETYKPSEMSTAIDNISTGIVPTGTISITENGTFDVTNYASANVDVSSSDYNAIIDDTKLPNLSAFFDTRPLLQMITKLPSSLNTSNWTSVAYLFYGCKNVKEFPTINTNKVLYFDNMFYECALLEETPTLNTANGSTAKNMFYGCTNLKKVNELNLSNFMSFDNIFDGCSNLEIVPIFHLNNTVNNGMGKMFRNCPKLNVESLNNILATCISATKVTKNKTLKYIGLTSTQATTCESLSNYQAFLDAGWTTGY